MRFTEAEWQLMNALWKGTPATAREIADRLPDEVDWAYTTIKTMLTRLVAKGAIAAGKHGNVSLYEPLVSRDRARKSALSALLDQAFGGGVAPLLHFLAADGSISAREKREIRRLLEEEDGEVGGRDA